MARSHWLLSAVFIFCSGVYLKPTEEQNTTFDERVKWLENAMTPRRELYEAEEKTLRVMLAEEEEEKEKERREMERRNQGRYWFVSSLYQKISRAFWSDYTPDTCYCTGLLFWPITKHTDNPMNQSKLEVNSRGWHEARENVPVQASPA